MLAIKINSCQNPLFWYSELIGKLVPYIGVDDVCHEYLSREPDGYINIVKVLDGEVVQIDQGTALY